MTINIRGLNHLSSGGVRIIRQKPSAVLNHMRPTQDLALLIPNLGVMTPWWIVRLFCGECKSFFQKLSVYLNLFIDFLTAKISSRNSYSD